MARYSKVQSASDITRINEMIRTEVTKAKTIDHLNRLRKESQYLYTLSFSPAWKKDLHGKLTKVRDRAENEYTTTTNTINRRLKTLHVNKQFDSKIG